MEKGVNKSRDFFVGRVAVDWVTLTTYDHDAYSSLVSLAEDYIDYKTSVSQKRMQYSGLGGDGFFFGKGLQGSIPHYMIVLSGVQSAVLAPVLATSMFARMVSCSRIDIQLTLPSKDGSMKTGSLGYELRKRLEDGAGRVGKRPSVTVWDNEDGKGDTVYVGSRSSDKYVRIYDKFGDGFQFLRYECEFKRSIADRIWQEFIGSESALCNWLSSTVVAPLREFAELEEMIAVMQEKVTAEVWIEVAPRDDERTLGWLRRQVTPAVVRLSMTELRQELRQWLTELEGMV